VPAAPHWATTAQVAAAAGIHQTTVGRWLKLGLLPTPEIRNMGRRGRTTRWPLHAPAQAQWVKARLDEGSSFAEIAAMLAAGEFVAAPSDST
jgi:DNA-binding transcriptional MerR regulator